MIVFEMLRFMQTNARPAYVRPDDVAAVVETNDGHAAILVKGHRDSIVVEGPADDVAAEVAHSIQRTLESLPGWKS